MTLARIKTTSGWIDLSKIGPQGPKGDKGDVGNDGPPGTVYDSDQIGTVKGWSGKTIPTNWVICAGGAWDKASYPQGWDFAKQEADAGNPLWTYTASTFTVPNLLDKFIYGGTPGNIGQTGGEPTHLLTAAESGVPAHSHPQNQLYQMDNSYASGMPAQTGSGQNQGVTSSPTGNNTAIPASTAHNNMPPYVVVAMIVKIKGVTIDGAGAITGPPGPPGSSFSPGVWRQDILIPKTGSVVDNLYVRKDSAGVVHFRGRVGITGSIAVNAFIAEVTDSTYFDNGIGSSFAVPRWNLSNYAAIVVSTEDGKINTTAALSSGWSVYLDGVFWYKATS